MSVVPIIPSRWTHLPAAATTLEFEEFGHLALTTATWAGNNVMLYLTVQQQDYLAMAFSLPQRVPENAPGDFYVEAGLCTRCCLVHGEAPELLNDPAQPFEECFFRRQPQTSEEIDQAISAICVSEMCALRYGGSDPVIIAKLRARQLASRCDHTPEGRAWISEIPSPAPPPTPRASLWRKLFGGRGGAR